MKRLNYLVLLLLPLFFLTACDNSLEGMRDSGVETVATDIALFSHSIESGESVWLMAGQHYKAGLVRTEIDNGNLIVTYSMLPGWCLYETHLHVATSVSDIPQTPGRNSNPIPGHFEYGDDALDCASEWSQTIPLAQFGGANTLYIAAHAVVKGCVEDCDIIYGITHADDAGPSGLIFALNPATGAKTFIADVGPDPSGNADWPNALAFDHQTNRLYYALRNNQVRYFDLNTLTDHASGSLAERSAGATFVNGALYYIPHNETDDLRRVTFAGGSATDIVAHSNFTGDPGVRFIFGDVVYKDGYIYMSARRNTDVNPADFASIRLSDGDYTLISREMALMQLAFNKDRTILYGHVTQQDPDTGNFFEIDWMTGTKVANLGAFAERQFNDLTEGMIDCRDGEETAWGQGKRFTDRGNWGMYFKLNL
jgi:hypothetical protein